MSVTASRSVARGRLVEQNDQHLVLALPNTDYRLHLVPVGSVEPSPTGFVTGHIHARAKRVDVVRTGGRYIEPVIGRPRRLQGTILAIDTQANTITVSCGCPINCELTANQQAGQFELSQLVSFDVESGATFTPVA